ncbi:hypothetical protein EIK77_003827 [Talaromyces pinophilus]|nr:hypothetical protein EIK77_003827 [Talaromyces pinophilus]
MEPYDDGEILVSLSKEAQINNNTGFIEEQEEQEEERNEEKIINEGMPISEGNKDSATDYFPRSLGITGLTSFRVPDKPYSTHRLLLGTHTSNDAPNYLQIAHVQLPNPNYPEAEDYDEERGEIGGYGGGSKKSAVEVKFNIVQKIDHKGEVNKARYQPQNPNIIATMCTDGRVMIWDRSKHPSIPTGTVNPQLELLGHTKEGFGLSWSPHAEGKLKANRKCRDMETYTKSNKAIKPTSTYTHHSSIVNDVQYHPLHSSLIGTVSDDITLQIIDIRESDTTKAAAVAEGQHRDAINAIAFNPAAETVLATGSADKSIGLWDLRNLKSKLHALECHSESVTSVSWHPFEESVLASASYDRKIMFWDLSRAGEEQTPEDAQDGPPEL